MPLRYALVGRFIIHEAAAVSVSHLFGFLFEGFKIAAIPLSVDLLIQRHQMRILRRDIVHDRLLESAAQVQVLQPDQVALILRPFEKIASMSVIPGNTGEMKHTVRMPAS